MHVHVCEALDKMTEALLELAGVLFCFWAWISVSALHLPPHHTHTPAPAPMPLAMMNNCLSALLSAPVRITKHDRLNFFT